MRSIPVFTDNTEAGGESKVVSGCQKPLPDTSMEHLCTAQGLKTHTVGLFILRPRDSDSISITFSLTAVRCFIFTPGLLCKSRRGPQRKNLLAHASLQGRHVICFGKLCTVTPNLVDKLQGITRQILVLTGCGPVGNGITEHSAAF